MEKITYLVANYNNGKYITDCVDSLNRQTNPNRLCLIADDKSTDNSLETILPLLNEKIRLIANEQNLGYIGTLKKLIEHAPTDIVAILDPDDVLYPEATDCLLGVYTQNPGAGFVYSKSALFDESLTTCLSVWGGEVPPDKTSLQQGFIGHVKSFRVSVYRKTAGLDNDMLYAEDRDLVYKLEEVTSPVFIDRALYKWRRLSKSQSGDRDKKEIGFLNHIRAQNNALERRGIEGFESFYYRLFFRAKYLLDSDRCPHFFNRLISLYIRLLSFVDRRLEIRTTGRLNRETPKKRLAYYLWRYPKLSETFIQREIMALKQSGFFLRVIADAPDDLDALDEKAKLLADETYYLFPIHKKSLLRYAACFFLKRPLSFLSRFLYVVFHKYQNPKTIKEDIRVFLKAVYLAGVLKDGQIDHAHSPWAEVNSFILMIASELLGIPYSVEARAHEIHRKGAIYALPEKFGNAAFVITNSRFNEAHLKSSLNGKKMPEIHVIYEGLPLSEFRPNRAGRESIRQASILSVGRLVEQKGFVYLLKACRILKDKGYQFRCEIIGGTEEPLYTHYYETLKILHRQLALEDQVFFLKAQPFTKVLEAYRNADIFVLPCVTGADGACDITPNSLIEAMAMKLPVISTAQTAISEIVENGVNGILIAPNDENALAEAMAKLIDDEELRRNLGEKARRKIEERFNIEKNIVHYAALFSKR